VKLPNILNIRRTLFGLGSLLLLSTMAPTAHAGFVYFNLPGLHPGQSARVAEQIVCANPACTGLDYQFYVLNTGLVGIDGVALGLGVTPANYGAAIAGGVLTFASANGGGDGPFPNVAACAIAVCGGTTILGIPGNNPPLAGGPVFAWGFEEWQTAGTAGALPTTFYITRWYSPIQGPFSNYLAPGKYTRLDLFSTFGPAPGSGAVDPPMFDTIPFFEFEGINGDINTDSNIAQDWTQPCNPSNGNTSCTPGTVTGDPQFAAGTFQQDPTTPEPASIALVASGILIVGVCKWRRKRRA
jgi:hypothetical protein